MVQMATIRRASGVTVETNGPVEIVEERLPKRDGSGPMLTPPRPGRRRGRPGRAGRARVAARSEAIPNEADLIAAAMVDQNLKLVDSVTLRTAPVPAAKRPGRRRARRSGVGSPATDSTLVGVADLGVPLAPGEKAVVLLEQDGVYSWHTPEAEREVAGNGAAGGKRKSKGKGKRRGVAKATRVAHFRLDIKPVAPPPSKPGGKRKFGFVRKMIGKAVAFIFKVVAKPLIKGIAKWLERDVEEGLVHITGTDPTAWTRDGDQSVPIRSDRATRVLLMVHGTFSSTLGSFGSLGATTEGRAFFKAAFRDYDVVIGWDHRTLSVSPLDNAKDILTWFAAQPWPEPPTIDAVAFSRGGLVLRTLVEELMPGSEFEGTLRRAVFVACTNGGTELARPANWNRFADTYINVAAAGVRALSIIPGFTAGANILSEAIRGVGGLVKALANVIVDDNAIPGLAAMNPAGTFVKNLNTRQTGQPTPDDVWYGAVTSDFDPDKAAAAGRTMEIPPGLILKLADKGADALAGKPNDLVVHVEAMTQIDPGVGTYVREKLDYGTNGTVHHCRYFHEPDTADALVRWLSN